MKRKQSESRLATPYAIWSVLFIVIPLILIVFFSFTKQVDGRYMFTLDNFDKFFNVMYFKVVRRSLVLAFNASTKRPIRTKGSRTRQRGAVSSVVMPNGSACCGCSRVMPGSRARASAPSSKGYERGGARYGCHIFGN